MPEEFYRSEKDFWIEMSIREIWTQAHFAEISYKNIDIKAAANIDVVFSSIHSFLSHCVMVSKLLKSRDEKSRSIGDILNVSESSIIHNRKFRNNLEHYDKELRRWIRKKGVNANIGTYNIGPKSMIRIPNMVFVSHYDPTNDTFTFVNEDFNLGQLFEEVQRIKELADKWVKQVESGAINPPFVYE
jgi:hypothetical protein